MSIPVPEWISNFDRIADLAEYMAEQDWPMDEIVRMIRRPMNYASEYAEMCSREEGEEAALEDQRLLDKFN